MLSYQTINGAEPYEEVEMKTIRMIMINLFFLLSLSMANAGVAVYALQVDGLGCPFCTYGIEKQLSAIDGVDKVAVDLSKGQVVVIMKQNASLTEKQAQQAITDAGFTLRSFSQESEANNDTFDR